MFYGQKRIIMTSSLSSSSSSASHDDTLNQVQRRILTTYIADPAANFERTTWRRVIAYLGGLKEPVMSLASVHDWFLTGKNARKMYDLKIDALHYAKKLLEYKSIGAAVQACCVDSVVVPADGATTTPATATVMTTVMATVTGTTSNVVVASSELLA